MTPPPPGSPFVVGGGHAGKRTLWIGISVGLVVAIVASVVTIVMVLADEPADASEVSLEPAGWTGADPFTPTVATVAIGEPTPTTIPPASSAAGGGFTTYPGDRPGLYGATRGLGTCDPDQLVAFLEQNPTAAQAWAGILGLAVADIRSYVATLTSAVLTTDTRVTNHGFREGRATAIPAVLQAGTAVLVDERGYPVVRCVCGNPLTSPTPISSPRYTGTPWSDFRADKVIVIQRGTRAVGELVLIDASGTSFSRPVGTHGEGDAAPG